MLQLSQMSDDVYYLVEGEIVSKNWILRRIKNGTIFDKIEIFEEDEDSVSKTLKSIHKMTNMGLIPETIEVHGKIKIVNVDVTKDDLHEGFKCDICGKKFSNQEYPVAKSCPNCGEKELLFTTFVIQI